MAEFKPFNYGQAVAQGQANALRGKQIRDSVRGEQGRNMLNDAARSGMTGRTAIHLSGVVPVQVSSWRH